MKTRLFAILFVPLIGSASAQIKPPDAYAPLLPAVKEKMWKIDPNPGYAVKDVGNGVRNRIVILATMLRTRAVHDGFRISLSMRDTTTPPTAAAQSWARRNHLSSL
jgi:hypothetical protein